MLSIVLDLVAAYLIGKRVRSVSLVIISAIVAGLLSSACGNLILHVALSQNAGTTMTSMVLGFIWHPVVATVAALVFRRSNAHAVNLVPDQAERERRRELALEAQRELQAKK